VAKAQYKVIANSPWLRRVHDERCFRVVLGVAAGPMQPPYATGAQWACGRMEYSHSHARELTAYEQFLAECGSLAGQYGVHVIHGRPEQLAKCLNRFTIGGGT
jgi:hypothetical protein